MKYTKLIIITIAIFMFGMAATCAADTNETIIASETEQTIELSQADTNEKISAEKNELISQTKNNELISAGNTGTFAELRDNITAAGSTLTLNKNYECENDFDSEGIIIAKSITIDGNGYKIDAQGKARIFKILADNVALKNITFTNGKTTENGGAVLFEKSGTVSNCNFTDNQATGYYSNGGAVWMSSGSVENCNFTDNQATGNHSYGGAIYIGSGSVENCNFTGNKAPGNIKEIGALNGGGAVFFEYNGNLTNCNFIGNTATDCGGAVYFLDTGTVTNCNFTDNNATKYNGGAVYFPLNGTVSNCNFINNTASSDGGAVWMLYGSVENCNFTDNTASSDGGAVWMLYGSVENCNFTNNSASQGGAIRFSSTCTVTNCNFTDNSASYGGAILSNIQWDGTADTCIFKTGSDTTFNTHILPPTLNVDNFTTFYGSGEKLSFDLRTNISSIPVTNGNISISVYSNNEWVGNYSCLSGEGWIPDLPVGSYYAIFDTEYAAFQPVSRSITVIIPAGKYYVNVTSLTTNNKIVNITAKTNIPQNITWDGKLLFILSDGNKINATYGGNGTWWAMYPFADYKVYSVNASYIGLDNVTVNNGTITINKVDSKITLEDITLDYGESKNVTVKTEGATKITASINGTDVTVINNYTIPISGLAAGNYTLNVTTVPDGDYNSVSKEVKVIVNKATAVITVDSATVDIKVLDEVLSGATLTPSGAGNLTYKSSNETVVIVKDGKIKALAKGNATITVSFAGNENYTTAKNKTINVTFICR